VIADKLKWGEPLYTVVYITMIILFGVFLRWDCLQSDRARGQHAERMAGFIPGIRPGRSTSEYVSMILKAAHVSSARFYLALVCLLPEWMIAGIHLKSFADLAWWRTGFDRHFPQWILNGLGVAFLFWAVPRS